MPSATPVEIVVELVDSVSEELAQIRGELEGIDATSINIDVDINSTDEVAATEAQLQALARDRHVDIHTRFPGAVGQGFNLGIGELHDVADSREAMWGRDLPEMGLGGGEPGGVGGTTFRPGGGLDRAFGGGDFGFGREFRDFEFIDSDAMMRRSRRSISGVARALDRARPNIMQVWNAMAALIPVFVTLGAAAIGLAGAFVALGTAAVAIAGVGLLGWGSSVSESFQRVQEEGSQLLDTIGEILRPVGTQFQPILQGWMQGAPAQVRELVGPMEELTVFADTLSAAGAGFVDWIGEVLRAMTDMEGIISQIAMRFGEVAGAFLIDFMENMTEFAYDNQTALIQLSASLRELLGALLNVSVAVASVLAALSPLTQLVAFLAELMNTRLGRTLIAVTAILFTIEAAFGLLAGAIGLVTSGLVAQAGVVLGTYLPTIEAIIIATYEAIAAMSTLRAALISTGIGALLVGGGFLVSQAVAPGGSPGGSAAGRGGVSGGDTYLNIEGDVGRREMDRIQDTVPGIARTEIAMNEDMS